jgi:hypothetical protein
MTSGGNEGIEIHGGSIHAGNLAVGRGARIRGAGSVEAGQDLARCLEQFRRELERHADAVPASAVRAATAALEEELTKRERNPVTVRGLLTGITDAVRTVAPLITAAEALKAAVLALL